MSATPPPHNLDEVAPIPILPGPGEQLRTAREAAGMSVHEISTHMHLDSRIILALEADDYEELPAPTFVRGYLRGYARLLDLAPEPVLQAFEQRDFAPPSLVADIAVRSQVQSRDFPIRLVTYVVVAALVLLVVLWWRSQDFAPVGFDLMPAGEPAPFDPEAVAPAGEPVDPEPGVADPEPEAALPAVEPVASAPEAAAAAGEPEASGAEAVSAGEPSRSAPEAASPLEGDASREADALATGTGSEAEATGAPPESAPRAAGEALETVPPPVETVPAASPAAGAVPEPEVEGENEAPPAPSEDLSPSPPPAGDETLLDPGAPADRLDMSFDVECWLEVYDHADDRLFYGLAQPGERLSLSGRGPIRVVLGNSEGVEVLFNGTPIDFSSFVVRGVARFSVGGEPPTLFRPAAPEPADEPEAAGEPEPGAESELESTGDVPETQPAGATEPAGE